MGIFRVKQQPERYLTRIIVTIVIFFLGLLFGLIAKPLGNMAGGSSLFDVGTLMSVISGGLIGNSVFYAYFELNLWDKKLSESEEDRQALVKEIIEALRPELQGMKSSPQAMATPVANTKKPLKSKSPRKRP